MSKEDMSKTINRLHNLAPGETVVYFTGFLEYSRSMDAFGDFQRVAQVAYDLATAGKVLLTQRRISPPVAHGGVIDWKLGTGQGFEYRATGAHPRKKAPVDLASQGRAS